MIFHGKVYSVKPQALRASIYQISKNQKLTFRQTVKIILNIVKI